MTTMWNTDHGEIQRTQLGQRDITFCPGRPDSPGSPWPKKTKDEKGILGRILGRILENHYTFGSFTVTIQLPIDYIHFVCTIFLFSTVLHIRKLLWVCLENSHIKILFLGNQGHMEEIVSPPTKTAWDFPVVFGSCCQRTGPELQPSLLLN